MARLLDRVDRRVTRYGVVGASGVVVDVAILTLLVEVGGVPVLAANVVSFLTAVASNYTLNRIWTFADRAAAPSAVAGLLFLGAALIGLGINELGLWALTEEGAHYLPAKLVMTGVVFVWNYGFNNTVTFRQVRTHSSASRTPETPHAAVAVRRLD